MEQENSSSVPIFPEATNSSNRIVSEEEQLVFEIKFQNKNDYKRLVKKVVNTLTLELNTTSEKYVFSVLETENSVRAFLSQSQLNDKNEDLSILGNQDQLFMVDTAPAVSLDKGQVPSYKRSIKDILDVTTEYKKQKSDVDRCQRPRPTSECFNCGFLNHELRDCPKPRNNIRINRAKKLFSSKQERYHVDIEQRFAHLRPGVITPKLQSALGLQKGELPFFFYRMRLLGYPPGWLEDARVSHSGMSLFNSDGAKVIPSDDDNDDGDKINDKFDISKIIEFPGFNQNPGMNFYDDYKHHNVPPLSNQDMKNEFIRTLGGRVVHGYKRRKLKSLPITTVIENTSTVEVTDMELEDESSELVTKSDVSSVPSKQTHANEDLLSSRTTPLSPSEIEKDAPEREEISDFFPLEHRALSPTLADLEEQQQKLLLELKDDISTNSIELDEVTGLETTHYDSDQSCRPKENLLQTESKCMAPSTPVPLVNNKVEMITASLPGTPVLKFSPYEKLPDGVNFKVGVSDVINFENLPDSTGKYEHMKVVIKKVRNIIMQLHNEDD